MKKEPAKRPRGRPATGREFTHEARVLLAPETWDRLQARAKQENRSAAAIIRELVDRYLSRRP